MPFCARDLFLHPRATRCSAFDPSTFWPWRINALPKGTALPPSTSTGRTPTAKSSFRLVIRLFSPPLGRVKELRHISRWFSSP